jgi:hypothetical protein
MIDPLSHAAMDAHPMHYTIFADKRALRKSAVPGHWGRLIKSLEKPLAVKSKDDCPLLKLATFGDKKSATGCLRSDDNMVEICGIEGDVDSETLTVAAAAQLLSDAGVESFIYTSASHEVLAPPRAMGGPKFRVLVPLSNPHTPDQRRALTAKLNHVLGGVLAPESFTASQSYYWGQVQGVKYETRRVRGQFIDLLEGQGETYGSSGKKQKPGTANGPTSGGQEESTLDMQEALRGIATGEVYHPALVFIAASYIATGMAPGATVNALRALMDASEGPHDERWRVRRASIPGIVSSAAAKFSPGGEDLESKRREYQKRENEKIGQGLTGVPTAETVNLDTALGRFVFLSDGSRVGDVFNPHFDLALPEWANTYAASKVLVQPPPDANGVIRPAKLVPMSELWRADPKRKTVVSRTFKAGGPMTLLDPHGRLALNTWRPYDRTLEVADMVAAGVGLFLDHVHFLFGTDANRFLDWLAHIEQRPGELPHVGWLHISQRFGMGRNWLAGVLTRVWAGNVAANVDLPALLSSGFTGQLSRKVLAFVDEIREGGGDSQWAHAERLKSLITEEQRLINPKFGRQSIEFNSCRWLLFSNHLTAIPLDASDRRFEVVVLDAERRDAAYYEKLYSALKDPMFIAAVAKWLGQRDTSTFSPGAHAKLTESKKAAAKASQTPMAERCELLVAHWPSDLITARLLYRVLDDRFDDGSLSSAHRRTLEQFGVEPLGRTVKIEGKAARVSILRNKYRWRDATGEDIAAEVAKAKPEFGDNPLDYLLRCSADEAFAASEEEEEEPLV